MCRVAGCCTAPIRTSPTTLPSRAGSRRGIWRMEARDVSQSGSLDQICEQRGIVPRYRDHAGAVREVPEATLRLLVQCLNATRADRILPPVFVWREGDGAVTVPINRPPSALRWTLEGQTQSLTGTVDDNSDR